MSLVKYNPTKLFDYYSPLDQLFSLQKDLDRFFGDGRGSLGTAQNRAWMPALDLYEDDSSFILKAELPGLKKEDIQLSVENGVLSLSGERKSEVDEEKQGVVRSERYFGKFVRSVSLPPSIKADEIVASYKDGILTVNVPKADEVKSKSISIAD